MDLTGLTALVCPTHFLSLSSFLTQPVLLYFGPETIMPITSVLAAGVGFVLIFWRHVTNTFRAAYRRLFIRKQVSSDSDPNVNTGD